MSRRRGGGRRSNGRKLLMLTLLRRTGGGGQEEGLEALNERRMCSSRDSDKEKRKGWEGRGEAKANGKKGRREEKRKRQQRRWACCVDGLVGWLSGQGKGNSSNEWMEWEEGRKKWGKKMGGAKQPATKEWDGWREKEATIPSILPSYSSPPSFSIHPPSSLANHPTKKEDDTQDPTTIDDGRWELGGKEEGGHQGHPANALHIAHKQAQGLPLPTQPTNSPPAAMQQRTRMDGWNWLGREPATKKNRGNGKKEKTDPQG
jgi:hypothetical protein